ncbi:cAMP-binding protein [Hyella patelloides LEGE 07179]|uniref:cAMP-binding protein n=1 Tax=Hyella patelloides LEGE 07179 TaxID=945734 RepID=A0A563VXT7_9CYAN|nr:Crp/Fnr family transcriptional regulator [Hyella patelloides]VEP16230.1 cAMP-binding protein [Hyella patelloides LEGE 07179]
MLLSDRPALNLQLEKKKYREEQYLDLYQKGEEIPLVNSGLWQVYQGVVQLNRFNQSQGEVVIGWVTPNHVFGSTVNNNSAYCAIAMTDVYVRHYQPKEIIRNPQLARQLLSELSYRLVKSEQMVAITSLRKVEDRLLGLLTMLKGEMGHPVAKGTRLTARFTHQNIADAICTTRVTVTRVFGDLQNKGLLEFDSDRHLIIKF